MQKQKPKSNPTDVFLEESNIKKAKVNKMDDKIGTLEIGKEADLIIVDGKPDKNIDDLSKIKQVYINGNRLI